MFLVAGMVLCSCLFFLGGRYQSRRGFHRKDQARTLPNPPFEVGPRTQIGPFEVLAATSIRLPYYCGRCGANST